MVHQWGFRILHQRHTFIYSGSVTANLPRIHSSCSYELEKGLQSHALHPLLCGWRAGTCCVIHVIPHPPHCPLSCPPACPGHPPGPLALSAQPCHSQEEQVTKTAHRSSFQCLKIWSSRAQYTAKWDHHSVVWAETFPLLSSPNCPVCSLTTFPFLSAPGLGHYISTKMEILLLCIHPLSQCQGSLRAISQPEITQPGKEHPFPAFLFLSHSFYPKLLPKEISILWCGRSCIYPQVIFDHCVNLSPANVLGR